MSTPKAQDLYSQWKAVPNADTETQLLRSLEPTISTALKSYGAGDARLKTRAYILAKEAIKTYDPKHKTAVTTHVYNNLQRLRRYSAERSNAVHIPENVRLDSLAAQRFVDDYKDRKGYEPSILDVADKLKWSQARARKALGAFQETPESFTTSDKGDDLTKTQRRPEDIWEDYVYHDLDERNRKIYEWATGYNGSKQLQKQEIAKRLKISPAAVSQRLSSIAKRLEAYYEQV